ncbi:MAG: copper homeostasis protein CutC [Saprospiraceae bacterium]
MSEKKVSFELCCADIRAVQLAEEYKLDGIELCINLTHGGLTPSIELIKKARSIFSSELAVLFRIRKGNFYYSKIEKEIMLADMHTAINFGIDTIVFGALNEDLTIDQEFIKQVIDQSNGYKLCFHKAFDQTNSLIEALQVLQNHQIDRVLCSGGKGTAQEEKKNLKLLQDNSYHQIELMAGGKINPTNVNEILQATGVQRIHAALLDDSNETSPYGSAEIASRKKIEELLNCLSK